MTHEMAIASNGTKWKMYLIKAKALVTRGFIKIYCIELLKLRIYDDNIMSINIRVVHLCIIYRRGAAK
jgi:hypothetical protein